MKTWLVVLGVVLAAAVIVAVALGALFFSGDSGSEATGGQPCEHDAFGHISSLTRSGDQYEMRFDPAWFTSGVTANTAAAEDGVVAPGESVPNDNYRVDEGHRLLTYLVPPDADVTVLTNNGTGILSTPVSVSELAQLSKGEKPVELFEPLETGFWMRYEIDTVCSLDQQYLP
jgi:hypothetical protein